jgi:hypothetical protein
LEVTNSLNKRAEQQLLMLCVVDLLLPELLTSCCLVNHDILYVPNLQAGKTGNGTCCWIKSRSSMEQACLG